MNSWSAGGDDVKGRHEMPLYKWRDDSLFIQVGEASGAMPRRETHQKSRQERFS